MKTKNIAKTLLTLSLFAFASCQSFLDEDPRSTVTQGFYYKDAAQAEENIISMYRMGAPVRYSVATSAYIGPTASINTFLTGYFSNNYEGQELVCLYARQLTRQDNQRTVSNTMNSIWNDSYRVINIANGAIKYIPEIDMDEGLKKRLIAEAKFFRAFNYFYLVKTFGDIPLPVEPYDILQEPAIEREDIAKVYSLIEEDLKEAVDVLGATTFTSSGYRITKYVAAMALANVYLQQGKFAETATTIRIVTNSPHKLTANTDLASNSAYNMLRTEDKLPEVIYSYEFDEAINNSGRWPSYAFTSSATSVFDSYAIFERVYGPSNRYLNVYKADDLRVQPNQYFHWEYTNEANNKTWSSDAAGIWYYFDEQAVLKTGVGSKDWNIYRYAEALLIAAEAIAKSEGVTAEAAGYLAEIKARADTHGKTVASYQSELQGLSVDQFVQECWSERLRELPLEFKMWDDCLRTGMFPVISETEKGKITYETLVGAKNGAGATIKKSDLLWPISMDERQRNPKLTQNEGYSGD